MSKLGAATVSPPSWEGGDITSAADAAGDGEGDITDCGYGDVMLDTEPGEPIPLSTGDSGIFSEDFLPDDCFFVALC